MKPSPLHRNVRVFGSLPSHPSRKITQMRAEASKPFPPILRRKIGAIRKFLFCTKNTRLFTEKNVVGGPVFLDISVHFYPLNVHFRRSRSTSKKSSRSRCLRRLKTGQIG